MLKIYDSNQVDVKDVVGYITTSHNGVLGEAYDQLLYIRNNDVEKYYTSVVVQAQDVYGSVDTTGPAGTGWGIKLSKGSRRPTPLEWENIGWNNFLSMNNIGTTDLADTSTYFPFWLLVVSPGNISAQIKTDITIVASALAHLIGT